VTAPDLSALVSARLCHDLISPMGAIGNGLELLQLSGNAGAAELELIGESLATALAKLRFYRIAFGPADPEARLTFEEAAQVTDAMFQGRFGVAWTSARPDMPRPLARLIYLAILCLEKSLPMGGTVRVDVTADGIGLAVEGRRTMPPRALWALATEGAPVPDLRPDGVQFALLRQALADTGHRIETRFSDTGAALRMITESPMLV
jgi:histidine phosphotransferase ChpT